MHRSTHLIRAVAFSLVGSSVTSGWKDDISETLSSREGKNRIQVRGDGKSGRSALNGEEGGQYSGRKGEITLRIFENLRNHYIIPKYNYLPKLFT